MAEIPLLPNGEIVWNAQDMPDAGGVLYVAPNVSPDIVDNTMVIARGDWQNTPVMHYLNRGTFGTVSRIGDVAFKKCHHDYEETFSPPEAQDLSFGLSAMRATVMLHTGLKKLAGQGTTMRVPCSSPELYACFVSNDPAAEGPATTWAMSYERGRRPGKLSFGMPNHEIRRAHYDQAIEVCGGDPSSVDYDDSPSNLLVKHTPFRVVKQIVKIDTTAWYTYEWE